MSTNTRTVRIYKASTPISSLVYSSIFCYFDHPHNSNGCFATGDHSTRMPAAGTKINTQVLTHPPRVPRLYKPNQPSGDLVHRIRDLSCNFQPQSPSGSGLALLCRALRPASSFRPTNNGLFHPILLSFHQF
mmetsp:Transcript_19369/g.40058  ORF Transcript_19369/g.40058 Transcript_19369/m.40058 type:complete len:132 (-) Transcript_19369:80-475(-)